MSLFHPLQVVLVSCRGTSQLLGKKEERDDVVPVTWHMPVSSNQYAVVMPKSVLGASLVQESKVFAVNFIPFSFSNIAKKAMSFAGDFSHKCKDIGIDEIQCETIDCFHVKGALGYFECEVIFEKEFGENILFIGSVKFSQKNIDEKRLFHKGNKEFTTTVS